MPAGSMSLHDDDPELHHPVGQRAMHVLPASQYLQERLSERRARQSRPKRARHTDVGPQFAKGRDDDIFLAEASEPRDSQMHASSPIVAARSSRGSEEGTQHSERRRRTVGLRDMDEQMDRLHKQNFALKLELDHRREQTLKLQQRIESMQEQVERALIMEEEHKELLRINSELVQELEKRDKAVEEAMDLICELEDQVGDLQERSSNTRPSTAHADSGYAGTETPDQDPRSSPLRAAGTSSKTPVGNHQPPTNQASAASYKLQGLLNTQIPAKPKRQPSIMSSIMPSTQTLRSVYMESSRSLRLVQSFQSLLSRQEHKVEEDGEDVPKSPGLSVLSESSFPSIYSAKNDLTPDRYDWEAADAEAGLDTSQGSRAHTRQDSIKRVSQWMSARDAVEATPSKSNCIFSPLQDESDRHSSASSRDHYQSLNDALASGVESVVALGPAADIVQNQHHLRRHKPGRLQNRPLSLVINERHMPPTPDSVSTRMLRDSRSSINKDKSPLDTTPALVECPDDVEPGLRTAPRQMRSSVELRTAYNSNLQFRNTALDGHQHEDNSDAEYVRHGSQRGETSNDSPFAYDGFPDGESIKMGTPSRFQSHARPPPDRHDVSPTVKPRAPRRRRSSEQTIGATAQASNGDGTSSVGSVVGPRFACSQHSNSSDNPTVTMGDEQPSRAPSPSLSPAVSRAATVTSPCTRASPSPARTLSKKMPKFIRRLSNTMLSEASPLPTLTSTPSSAYAHVGPPRPKTSQADRLPPHNGGTITPRAPSTRDPRPLPLARTSIDMNPARPASAAGTERERRSLFRRSNSVKRADQPDASATETQQIRGAIEKRRGSIRDVVTSRRPWR